MAMLFALKVMHVALLHGHGSAVLVMDRFRALEAQLARV